METTPLTQTPSQPVTYGPQVRDLMTTEVFTLFADDNLNMLDELMKWARIRHVPVVDDNQELVGLVTHRDFLRAAISSLAEQKPGEAKSIYGQVPVRSIMQTEVKFVAPDITLSSAAELMATDKYGCLPVVDNGRLVGIITEADFVRAFYEWDVSFAR